MISIPLWDRNAGAVQYFTVFHSVKNSQTNLAYQHSLPLICCCYFHCIPLRLHLNTAYHIMLVFYND